MSSEHTAQSKQYGRAGRKARAEARRTASELCKYCEMTRHEIIASGGEIENHGDNRFGTHEFVTMSPDMQRMILQNRATRTAAALLQPNQHMCADRSDERCPFGSEQLCNALHGIAGSFAGKQRTSTAA